MRRDGTPADLDAVDARLRRAVDARVDDVDALWERIGSAIDADVVVPLRGRSRRRTTAFLLAATLALGGSALAGLGIGDTDDPSLSRHVTDFPSGGSGSGDRKGSRGLFAAAPGSGVEGSDDGGAEDAGHPGEGAGARPDPTQDDGRGEDDDADHGDDPSEADDEDGDERSNRTDEGEDEGEDGSGDADASDG